eukprot:2896569-Amphidinium_carterae.1
MVRAMVMLGNPNMRNRTMWHKACTTTKFPSAQYARQSPEADKFERATSALVVERKLCVGLSSTEDVKAHRPIKKERHQQSDG